MTPRHTISRITSRIDDLAERLAPSRGPITIIRTLGEDPPVARSKDRPERAAASAGAAIRGASIVATATNSIEPVLFASWLEPGMFITSVKELEFDDAEVIE